MDNEPTFIDFLANFGVITVSVATALGVSINQFVTSLSENIISPFVAKHFHVRKMMWRGMNIGAFLSSFVNLVIALSLTLVLSYYLIKYILKDLIDKKNLEYQKEQIAILQSIDKTEKDKMRVFGPLE